MSENNACTLEVVTDGKSRTITLDEKVVTFGRSRKNSVALKEDGKISAEHCQVIRQKDAWMLIDNGSKNKTFLNGTAISVAALKHGDTFKIGETTVTFRVGAPTAMDPKEAERLMAKKPSANTLAGDAIAAALSKPVEPRAARKSSGVREAVKVERGGKGVSSFAMICFFFAGILSGFTALHLFDNRNEKKPVSTAKVDKPQPLVQAPSTPVAVPVQPAPAKVDPAVAPKEDPKDPAVAVEPKVTPKETPVVAPKETPKDPVVAVAPKETPKEDPAKPPKADDPVVKKDPTPPPPAASDDPPPAAGDPVAVKPPDDPKGDPGTTVDPSDDAKRTPTQFLGLRTTLKRVIFVMDVTGSMEDPAAVTPAEFSGPPEIKIGADLKRQLDKFDRKEIKTKLDAAKYELTHTIAYLHPDVEFTVIFFSFSPTPWQKRFMPATEKNKIDAMKRIKTTSAWGGTNIFDALECAIGIVDDFRKTAKKPATPSGAKGKPEYAVFLLTDGKHNTGRFPDPEEFLKEIRKMNSDDRVLIDTIGVGTPGVGVDPPDPVFLARLASENGGESKMLK